MKLRQYGLIDGYLTIKSPLERSRLRKFRRWQLRHNMRVNKGYVGDLADLKVYRRKK
jgi:hypothetical protein